MTPQPQPPRPHLRGNVHYLETEFATRVRFMVISLAKREARKAVIRQLRAEGHKPTLMSASEITSLANVHLRAHTAELLAQAEASGIVRNLRLKHERKLVDLEAKSLIENPVQNGGAK
jgi:hypothetical protein